MTTPVNHILIPQDYHKQIQYDRCQSFPFSHQRHEDCLASTQEGALGQAKALRRPISSLQ